MKTRVIQTRFWDDEFVVDASRFTKYLYIYLLTSQYINICGVFQLPDKKIMFETGLSQEEFELAKRELTLPGKVLFYKGWVYVTNAARNNNYTSSPKNVIAHNNEVKRIPLEVKEFFKLGDSTIDTSIDTSIYSTHKSKSKSKSNSKPKEIKNKEKVEGVKDLSRLRADLKNRGVI